MGSAQFACFHWLVGNTGIRCPKNVMSSWWSGLQNERERERYPASVDMEGSHLQGFRWFQYNILYTCKLVQESSTSLCGFVR